MDFLARFKVFNFFFFFDIIGTKLVREGKENRFERNEQRKSFVFIGLEAYKLIELVKKKEGASRILFLRSIKL